MLLQLLSLASGALAFAGTHPLIAVSNERLDFIDALSPSHPSNAKLTVFEAVPNRQQAFEAGDSTGSELCATLDSLVIVSAPGLHESDLATLRRSTLARLSGASKTSLNVPYVEQHKSKFGQSPEEKLAKRFINECGASLQLDVARPVNTNTAKVLSISLFEDELEYIPLAGKEAKQERRQVLERLNQQIESVTSNLRGSWLFVLTELPPSSADQLRSKLAKRQFGPDSDDYSSFPPFLQQPQQDNNSSKSIFAPPENGGVLTRYVVFSPSILLCLLVTVLIFAPSIYFGSQVLKSATTFHGLEHKMTGSAGAESSSKQS